MKIAKKNPFIQIDVLGPKFDNVDLSAHFFYNVRTAGKKDIVSIWYKDDGLS